MGIIMCACYSNLPYIKEKCLKMNLVLIRMYLVTGYAVQSGRTEAAIRPDRSYQAGPKLQSGRTEAGLSSHRISCSTKDNTVNRSSISHELSDLWSLFTLRSDGAGIFRCRYTF